jgi:hypothetical protein
MTVAYAGHVVGGYGYCECDGTNCVLGLGKTQGATTSGQPTTNGVTAPPDEGTAIDPDAGVMLLTLALLFGLRLRF